MGNSVKKRLMAGLCILALAVGVFLGNSVQPVYTKSKLSALHVTRKARWCSCEVSVHTDFHGIRNT